MHFRPAPRFRPALCRLASALPTGFVSYLLLAVCSPQSALRTHFRNLLPLSHIAGVFEWENCHMQPLCNLCGTITHLYTGFGL
jgi:hypothetical protein